MCGVHRAAAREDARPIAPTAAVILDIPPRAPHCPLVRGANQPALNFGAGKGLRVPRWCAGDPLNLLQVMLAKGLCSTAPSSFFRELWRIL